MAFQWYIYRPITRRIEEVKMCKQRTGNFRILSSSIGTDMKYHHSDRKNRLLFIVYIPIQSIRFCIPKLPCGGGPCSRIISCLHHPHQPPLGHPVQGFCPPSEVLTSSTLVVLPYRFWYGALP